MDDQKKFKIVTLGCRTNQYESQGFRDQLESVGLVQAKKEEKADVCIVNTCTVTESADRSSRHEIRQLVRENPGAKVVVTGCFAERDKEAVLSIEGVLDVVPNAEKENTVFRLFPEKAFPEFSIQRFEGHTRAFVKVQDGCNSFCTYCIIPYVRGRSRSRTIQEVVDEVKTLIAGGYKEIVLTGINIGDFDGKGIKTPSENLADLVRAVDKVEGLKRLRLSSIDPDEVDQNLTDAILGGQHTCPSMHIVLQSGSNVVLKRMNRKYNRQMFLETVDRLKKASSDFTFTTDIIVGFPGETEEDFLETLQVMKEVNFSKVHMFPYSERKRTKAALFTDKVPQEIIQKRKARLLKQAEQTAYFLREGYLNRKMTVLTESSDLARLGETFGHTENFLPVWVQGNLPSNTLVEVELIENTPLGLLGRILC